MRYVAAARYRLRAAVAAAASAAAAAAELLPPSAAVALIAEEMEEAVLLVASVATFCSTVGRRQLCYDGSLPNLVLELLRQVASRGARGLGLVGEVQRDDGAEASCWERLLQACYACLAAMSRDHLPTASLLMPSLVNTVASLQPLPRPPSPSPSTSSRRHMRGGTEPPSRRAAPFSQAMRW